MEQYDLVIDQLYIYIYEGNAPHIYVSMRKNAAHICVLVSIVVSIPACHAGDRGSIPRRGDICFCF